MARIVSTIIAIFLACNSVAWATPPPDPNEWLPDADVVARVDSLALRFELPTEFGALRAYARYYWGTARNGRRLIQGVFISPQLAIMIGADSSSRIHIVRENLAPAFADGGCTVIHVEFDVEANSLVETNCNFELPVPRPPSGH